MRRAKDNEQIPGASVFAGSVYGKDVVLMSSWKLSAYVIWTTVIVRADDAKSQDILLNANNYFADPVSLREGGEGG